MESHGDDPYSSKWLLKSRFLVDVTLTGDKDTSVSGNDQDNVLTGNVGDNGFTGGAGDDVIVGAGRSATRGDSGHSLDYRNNLP